MYDKITSENIYFCSIKFITREVSVPTGFSGNGNDIILPAEPDYENLIQFLSHLEQGHNRLNFGTRDGEESEHPHT